MVKVLCKGGPYYWVKEPFTDLEQRVWLWDLAEGARESRAYHEQRGHHDVLKRLEDYFLRTIAAAPATPPTKDERKRFRKEYPERYYLLDGEIYPRDAGDPPCRFMQALNNTTGFTFYGGSPHNPNPHRQSASDPVASSAPAKMQSR